MRKTNRFIYAYKIRWRDGLNLERLQTKFTKENQYDNFILNKDYVSLIFLGEEDDISFFSLIKGKNSNASVLDFIEKRDIHHFFKENEKLKNQGMIAFINNGNFLLTLFNHEAFGYSTGALATYLKTKLSKDIELEIITKETSEDYTRDVIRDAKNITVKKAQKAFRTYEQRVSGSSRKKIIKYIEGKEINFTLRRIKDLPENKLIQWIRRKRESNPDKIIVNTYNQGDIDLLDDVYLRFPCNVSVDEDGLALEEDFKNEIKRIVSQNSSDFEGY